LPFIAYVNNPTSTGRIQFTPGENFTKAPIHSSIHTQQTSYTMVKPVANKSAGARKEVSKPKPAAKGKVASSSKAAQPVTATEEEEDDDDDESEWSSEDEDEENGGVSEKGMQRLMGLVSEADLDEEERARLMLQDEEDEDEDDDDEEDMSGEDEAMEDESDDEEEDSNDEEDGGIARVSCSWVIHAEQTANTAENGQLDSYRRGGPRRRGHG
jgi:hypothetical protein